MSDPHDFTELDHFEIDPRSVRLLDEGFCRERHVVVLGRVERGGEAPVTVGMLDPSRRSLVREVASRLGRTVRPVRLNAFEVRRALDRGWGLGDPAVDRAVLRLAPVADLTFRPDAGAPEMAEQPPEAVAADRADDSPAGEPGLSVWVGEHPAPEGIDAPTPGVVAFALLLAQGRSARGGAGWRRCSRICVTGSGSCSRLPALGP